MRSTKIALSVLSVVLVLPATAFAKSKGPCTCANVSAMEDRLKMIDQTRTAWQQVQVDIFTMRQGSPRNMAEAKRDFRDKMGWESTRQVGGVDASTGEVIADPVWESQNCESIVEANKIHERSHARDWTVRVPVIVILSGPLALAKALANSEIDARNNEERYLQAELDRVKKDCKYVCKSNDRVFKTLPECNAQCPGKRTLAHLDICRQQ
jgi:hypothetical protein